MPHVWLHIYSASDAGSRATILANQIRVKPALVANLFQNFLNIPNTTSDRFLIFPKFEIFLKRQKCCYVNFSLCTYLFVAEFFLVSKIFLNARQFSATITLHYAE